MSGLIGIYSGLYSLLIEISRNDAFTFNPNQPPFTPLERYVCYILGPQILDLLLEGLEFYKRKKQALLQAPHYRDIERSVFGHRFKLDYLPPLVLLEPHVGHLPIGSERLSSNECESLLLYIDNNFMS